MKKIEVRNLTKVFGPNPKKGVSLLKEGKSKDEILKESGNTVGVNQASFDVNEGEFFVIMGLSGSGKSTLIRLVNRLIDPTSGSVLIDGEDITKMNMKSLIDTRRSKLGMVFQRFALLPHRTIQKNVEYGLEIQGMDTKNREEKAVEAIHAVGLSGYENSYPDELSGGMQQRVGLARALATDSDILLMDEAFSALDPLIRKDMQDELLELQDKLNKTILFITHDLDEALKLGDRIAIMKDGSIVQIGTSEEIMREPANDYVANFVQDVDRSKVLVAENVMKKPDVVTSSKDGPRVAVRRMKEKGISSIFVVDRGNVLKGLLTIEDAVKAIDTEEPLDGYLRHDYKTAEKDTPLEDLIPAAAETNYPIAVVENDRLRGIIVRVSILSGLGMGKGTDYSALQVHETPVAHTELNIEGDER
ncbi:glycine betaine/L-proline ABC transporter ATP-binding protein [Bacillus sp. H-16]|uniref:quaternary amine ABC transporter ATP-binding protein n=1 Tax=Alteribacter salitolerans TaxID=2912333 RepID=UPI0019668AF4|nr:glycine betaine/L-proline ABC transporter ATP-binding protein [Alteribacter salitolerans]MBM7094369.1 glycine betaine/L-proline ABC transporter ATP-binding protein [Alteribacter salitolerans]